MAQYLNKTDSELVKFPAWRCHNWRQASRELAGIRGCAPAVQFHDTTYDNSDDLLAPDDRIFKVNTFEKIYVWGQELGTCINFASRGGTEDSLNIYYRPHGSTNENDWLLVKGTDSYGSIDFASSDQFHPNLNLSSFSSNSKYYSGTSSCQYYTSDVNRFVYLTESMPTGFTHDIQYGEGTTSGANDKEYPTWTTTHLRQFMFMREGEYKLEIDETHSWNSSGLGLGFTTTIPAVPARTFSTDYYTKTASLAGYNPIWNPTGTIRTYQQRNLKLTPIEYSSNPGLYGTLPEQLKSFTGLSQTYRSRFTKTIIIKAYHTDTDLVTNTKFIRPTTTLLGAISTSSEVRRPYQRVVGYGSVWEWNPWNYFINVVSSGSEFTDVTTANQRFSKFSQRWNGTGKTLINRRHLSIEGITFRGNTKHNTDGATHFTYYVSPTENRIMDLRGSVFKDCTFEDINLDGARDQIIWGGCRFINCKFKRCSINMHADSVAFLHCDFEGRGSPTDTDCLNTSGNSNLYMACRFENNFRTFFIQTDFSPCTDNMWFKNIFDRTFFHAGGGESFVAEQLSEFLNTELPIGSSILAKQKNREFSRNMFIGNVAFDNSWFVTSTYQAFSRANLYFLNETMCQTRIESNIDSTTVNSTTQRSGGMYYDVHAFNYYDKLKVSLGENTHHFRFMYNTVNQPNIRGDRTGAGTSRGGDTYIEEDGIIFSIVSGYDNPNNGAWNCKHSSKATGNKIIMNSILNWGGQFTKSNGSPCSIYLNFFNVLGCETCNAVDQNDDYWNEMLDHIDTFDSNNGTLINVAYKNLLGNPVSYSNRCTNTVSGRTTNYCDPVPGFGDSRTSLGTFNHIVFPWGINCKETQTTFDCNSVYIGTGTNYPAITTNGNGNYTRISQPSSGATYNSGTLFNHLESKKTNTWKNNL